MESFVCGLCQKPKANFECSLCEKKTCKTCTEILPEGSFSFLEKIPDFLTHRYYCGQCFDEKVAPEQMNYSQMLSQARQLIVFYKNQSEETRLFGRNEKPLKVEGCADREETLLRLAFMAAQKKFNVLLSVELNSKKVRNHGYQTLSWSGFGIPSNVDRDKLKDTPKGKYFIMK